MGYLSIEKNQQIHYQFIDGDSKNPRLVFLHEGLGCIGMWKDFPTKLCQATNCPGLVYDRLGYGDSSPVLSNLTVHYLHNYASIELPLVLSALVPDQPIILIGHSDGGSIGLIYASEKPIHLLGIVTEAAHVFVDAETIGGIAATGAAFERGELAGLSKYHGHKTEQMFKAWSESWQSLWFRHWNIEHLLPSIECPVMAIQGLDDRYGTIDQVDAIVSKTGGYAEKVMISNCGHTPHFQHPQKVLKLIGEFIEKVKKR